MCGEGKLCVNSIGSYKCNCPDGYAENSGGVCEGEPMIVGLMAICMICHRPMTVVKDSDTD